MERIRKVNGWEARGIGGITRIEVACEGEAQEARFGVEHGCGVDAGMEIPSGG
jgi:hypothetical protein